MDRLLYVAMTGAKETLKAQAVNNHNLANASTTGFRADLAAFQAREVQGAGFESRVYATSSAIGFDDTAGNIQATGRDLDVAIEGSGFIAVQGRDGTEAYTRAGDLRVDPNGQLLTGTGLSVLGDGGPLSVPPHGSVLIGGDGTISIVPLGQGPETRAVVGRIKLVNPPTEEMARGSDGLFRLRSGATAEPDATTKLMSGALEGSNVNIADAMVNMIELARRFELQVKAMRTAEEDGAAAGKLLSIR